MIGLVRLKLSFFIHAVLTKRDSVSFPMNPGPVNTDMCEYSQYPSVTHIISLFFMYISVRNTLSSDTSGIFKNMLEGMGRNLPTTEEAADLLLKVIDNSTRENEGGEFIDVDGKKLSW